MVPDVIILLNSCNLIYFLFILAKKEYKKKGNYSDNRLSKREFRDLVFKIVSFMHGGDSFDYFVEFLLNSVEVSISFNKLTGF